MKLLLFFILATYNYDSAATLTDFLCTGGSPDQENYTYVRGFAENESDFLQLDIKMNASGGPYPNFEFSLTISPERGSWIGSERPILSIAELQIRENFVSEELQNSLTGRKDISFSIIADSREEFDSAQFVFAIFDAFNDYREFFAIDARTLECQ